MFYYVLISGLSLLLDFDSFAFLVVLFNDGILTPQVRDTLLFQKHWEKI